MAACGLDAGHRDSLHSTSSVSSYEDRESENGLNSENYKNENDREHVVTVMTRFAAEMMTVLDRINREQISNIEPYK